MDKGYTYQEIADTLTAKGLKIKANTLRQYMQQVGQPEQTQKGKPKSRKKAAATAAPVPAPAAPKDRPKAAMEAKADAAPSHGGRIRRDV